MNGLNDASDNDWAMISGLDEIPNPDSIPRFNPSIYLSTKSVIINYKVW